MRPFQYFIHIKVDLYLEKLTVPLRIGNAETEQECVVHLHMLVPYLCGW